MEHTRCPEEVVNRLLTSDARAARNPESQRQSGSGNRALSTSDLLDLLAKLDASLVETQATNLVELDKAIGELRMERYVDHSTSSVNPSGPKSFVRQCYYWLRPLFPVSFRKYLQRIALRGWDSIPFPKWPVDLTVERFMEAIWRELLPRDNKELPFIWFWPEGKSSACIMTHDVETDVGRDFCKTMMEIEKRHEIRSAFEIVPEQRYEVPQTFLQQIRDYGSEVCLHGLNHDGHLFSSQALFLERAKKINAYAKDWGAIGFRSPIMYRNLDWLGALEFSYDLSVPNMAHLDPQRGGCCTVMPYFIGDILELPLTTTQDYSLFHILQERSLDLWKKQVAMIRERHGLISFIIHPDYVTEKWSSQLYDALLGHLAELRSEHGVWIALPKDVDTWWRARYKMKLVRQNGEWKITGPQAERARVAYASLVDGKIQYRVENTSAAAIDAVASQPVPSYKPEKAKPSFR